MTTVEWPTILAFVTVLLAIGLSVYRERMKPALETREQILEKQVEELRNTVSTLLSDRTAAQRQIDALRKELDEAKRTIMQLQTQVAITGAGRSPAMPANSTILAIVGTDPALQVDLAALRTVAQRTGLKITRLEPVSLDSLERTLNSARKTGKPIKWVHASVHAGPDGLQFADGLATGEWLSEHLRGVEILLINGCQGTIPASWAGVVPAVISMREEIKHQDAADFCEIFWQAIGEGLSVEAAFNRALDWGPSNVAEFAELQFYPLRRQG